MLNKEIKDTALQALKAASKAGAQEAAAGLTQSREVEVVWRDGKLEKIAEATTRQLTLQLYVDGRYSMASSSDLRPDALPRFIEGAVAMTRTLARDPHRALPDPALYRDRPREDLRILDGHYETLTAAERRRQAAALEEAARAVPGSAAFLSVSTGVSDTMAETFRVASNGFEGAQRETSFFLSADVSCKDGDGRRPQDFAYCGTRLAADLSRPEEIGAEAARRALSRLGAKKGPSAVLPMVLENRAAGRLVGFLLGPLGAGAVQQKRSFLLGKVGARVGSDKLTLTDDPLLQRGLGSRLFDSEGISARRIPIFEGGVLRNYYVDDYYGRKLAMAPTTGRPSNVSFATSGAVAAGSLLGQVQDGYLVTRFLGGNSNATTGDFSLGVQGFRVRGGKQGEPITEMNISGNHLSLWQHLVALGDDPFPSSSLRTPTLLFDQVQFAGT